MQSIRPAATTAVPAILLGAGAAWAQGGERYDYGHHDMVGGWFGGVVMMLLMIALTVGAVILMLRLPSSSSAWSTGAMPSGCRLSSRGYWQPMKAARREPLRAAGDGHRPAHSCPDRTVASVIRNSFKPSSRQEFLP